MDSTSTASSAFPGENSWRIPDPRSIPPGSRCPLVAVTPLLEGAIDADELRTPGIVAVEALEVLELLAAIVDIPVLGLSEPVIGVLDELAVLRDAVLDHQAGHAVDELGLVEHIYHDGLVGARELPVAAAPQGAVGIRLGEIPEVAVEVGRVEVRVIPILTEGRAKILAGRALLAAELPALPALCPPRLSKLLVPPDPRR